MGKRRKGREIVLQSLYASMISGAKLDVALADQLARRESNDETALFARDLAAKLAAHRPDLDAWLRALASRGWNPDRIGMLEKQKLYQQAGKRFVSLHAREKPRLRAALREKLARHVRIQAEPPPDAVKRPADAKRVTSSPSSRHEGGPPR